MSKISQKKSNDFLKFLTSIKNLFLISTINIENAFYSENKSYQKFSISIINLVLKITNKNIYYISSDIDDKIHNKKIKNIYIGDGIVRNIFFLVIKAKNLFLTYDFVQNHNYIYLTNNKLFSSYYPYEYDFYNLIRNIYGGGTAVSNSFIIEGFASFGIFGLFLVSTVLIILFKIIDSANDFSEIKLNLLYIFQAICFLSYPISTHLTTYGLLPFILISLFKLKK